jgi:hypothetical protein
MRFWVAGFAPVHIAEVIYSWRLHGSSTAEDVTNKSYIPNSQRAVLERYVQALPHPDRFGVVQSSLTGNFPQFHIEKQSPAGLSIISVPIEDPAARAADLVPVLNRARQEGAALVFQQPGLRMRFQDWRAEAEVLFDLHPDAAMLGGIIIREGRIEESGCHFGFKGTCGDPHRGRPENDCGYMGELWKQRCVSAVSVRFAVMRADFLAELMQQIPPEATLGFLGAWAGAYALRSERRVVYTPFLGGTVPSEWRYTVDENELQLFAERNGDVIPDTRFYSRHFSRTRPFALSPRGR